MSLGRLGGRVPLRPVNLSVPMVDQTRKFSDLYLCPLISLSPDYSVGYERFNSWLRRFRFTMYLFSHPCVDEFVNPTLEMRD